jgi:hypothetical protein
VHCSVIFGEAGAASNKFYPEQHKNDAAPAHIVCFGMYSIHVQHNAFSGEVLKKNFFFEINCHSWFKSS